MESTSTNNKVKLSATNHRISNEILHSMQEFMKEENLMQIPHL